MAVSQSGSEWGNASAGHVASLALPVPPSNLGKGDTVLVWACLRLTPGGTTVQSVTDDYGNQYSFVGGAARGNIRLELWMGSVTFSGAPIITVTPAVSCGMAVSATAWTDVVEVTDKFTISTGASGAIASGATAATSVPDELVVAAVGVGSVSLLTTQAFTPAGTGFNVPDTAEKGSGTDACQVQQAETLSGAVHTQSYAASITGTPGWVCAIATLRGGSLLEADAAVAVSVQRPQLTPASPWSVSTAALHASQALPAQAVTAGNDVFVLAAARGSTLPTDVTVTDSKGNVWTLLGSETAGNVRLSLWRSTIAAGKDGAITITITPHGVPATYGIAGSAWEVSGLSHEAGADTTDMATQAGGNVASVTGSAPALQRPLQFVLASWALDQGGQFPLGGGLSPDSGNPINDHSPTSTSTQGLTENTYAEVGAAWGAVETFFYGPAGNSMTILEQAAPALNPSTAASLTFRPGVTAAASLAVTGTAVLGQRTVVAADAALAASAQADLVQPNPLLAAAVLVAQGQADIGFPVPLGADAVVAVAGTAVIGVAQPLAGDAVLVASGAGALGIRSSLNGNAVAAVTGQADAGRALQLSGSASLSAPGTATIGVPQQAVAGAVLSATGQAAVGFPLALGADAVLGVQGAAGIGFPLRLQANATLSVAANSDLAQRHDLRAAAVLTAAGAGNVTGARPLAADAVLSAIGTAVAGLMSPTGANAQLAVVGQADLLLGELGATAVLGAPGQALITAQFALEARAALSVTGQALASLLMPLQADAVLTAPSSGGVQTRSALTANAALAVDAQAVLGTVTKLEAQSALSVAASAAVGLRGQALLAAATLGAPGQAGLGLLSGLTAAATAHVAADGVLGFPMGVLAAASLSVSVPHAELFLDVKDRLIANADSSVSINAVLGLLIMLSARATLSVSGTADIGMPSQDSMMLMGVGG